jgi:CheY-like chemotaxis protein
MRILVVDDSAAIRLIVQHALRGHEVIEADSGTAALDLLERTAGDIDLILLDIMMPGLSGYGVLARLRADVRLRDLPVVMLTAKAGEHDHVAAFRAGADGYLTKPFDIDDVLGVLAEVAGRTPQERARYREAELSRAELLAQIESSFGR